MDIILFCEAIAAAAAAASQLVPHGSARCQAGFTCTLSEALKGKAREAYTIHQHGNIGDL
jgi:hypothetical protein